MRKVVILAINAKYVHSSLPAWVLAGAVSRYARISHDVKVVEGTINQDTDDIAGQVIAHQPDVVGVSTYIWNAGMLPGLLRTLRERLPKAALVLGGPEASHNAEYWLEYADYVLCGEGEQGFPALLDMLSGCEVLAPIPGLCYKCDGKTIFYPQAPAPGDPIDPYTADYFSALGGRIAYIETSRGCPFRCAFCLSGGSSVRFFPLAAAKDQLCRLAGAGARTIKLVDRTFNCNPERACELLAYMIGLDTDCRFHCEVAPDLFDARTLALLQTAPPGRIQLEAGLQSFFEPALRAACRQTDLEKAQANIRALVNGGNIHLHLDLIAGLPHETLPDFMSSFDRAYALGAHTLQLGFLKMLYGSALREQGWEIAYARRPPYEITSSRWLSAQDLQLLKQTENALRQTYNKGRFLATLRYALSVSGLRPFSLYRMLGEAAPGHATALEAYAQQVYACLLDLPGVRPELLQSHMICDWLSMVKGANMPGFLKIHDRRREEVAAKASLLLGRKISRSEAAVLPSGKGVFVDGHSRDPVTGLYQLHFAE